MTGRKRRGEPGYEWVEQLNKDQLEELANKLIKGKGEFTEEEVRKVIKRVCRKNKKLALVLVRKYRAEIPNLERECIEEITQSSDSDSLGSLDGEETPDREVQEQATVTDQRSKVPTAARADPRAGRSRSTEPDFPGFGEYFDSVQSPTELVAYSTPEKPKPLSITVSSVKSVTKQESEFTFEMAEDKPMTKYIQPDRYDGKGDIKDFFTRFEECAKNNKWNEEMKKEKFPLALGGVAHRYYKALIADRRDRDYEALKAAFEKRYSKNKEKISNKIASRLMGESEEIEDYYSEMVELCREADKDMSELQIVRNIINGVPNEYKRYMNPGEIETLEQLQEKIESATTTITLEKNTENRIRIIEMEKLSKKMENMKLGEKDKVKSELYNELEKMILEKKEKEIEKGKVNKVKAEEKGEKKDKKGTTNFVRDNRDNNDNRNFRRNGNGRGQRRNFGRNSRGRGCGPYRGQSQRRYDDRDQGYRNQNWDDNNDRRDRRPDRGRLG